MGKYPVKKAKPPKLTGGGGGGVGRLQKAGKSVPKKGKSGKRKSY